MAISTGEITAITVTSSGSGYGSMGPGGGGSSGGGSSGWVNNNTGTYYTSVGGNGTYGILNNVLNVSAGGFSNPPDLVLSRPQGSLKVGETLDLILEHLQLIIPNKQELESNPALKAAYDNYLDALKRTRNPEVQSAVDSYNVIRKLTKDDPV